MKTVDIRGKAYVPVNERLKVFREKYPLFSLRTELVNVNEETALVKAVIRDDKDRIIAEGTAHERVDQKGSMVNSTSHVENAETSAWGRALGNFGIGIDASVATADEVANAIAQQSQIGTVPPKNHAHSGTLMTIAQLCKQTGTEQVALFKHFKVTGVPTPEQAKEMVAALEKKLGKQLDDATQNATPSAS